MALLFGSGSSGSGNGSDSGQPPEFPYPGDGYDEAAWRAYDTSFAVIYGLLAFAAGALARRVGRQIRRDVAAGRQSSFLSVKGIRRAFYQLIFLQTLLRSVFFTLATLWRGPDITDDQTVALEVLVIVGDAVYFTSFTVLLAYWGLVDVSSRGLLERRALIVRACLALNGLFYLTLLVFTLLAVNDVDRDAVGLGFVIVIFCFSTSVALGFLLFTIRMVRKLRELPTSNRVRMIVQVVLLAGICTLCFVYRAIFVLTVPRRQYGNLGAVASYLVAGEVVPLVILLGAFFFLPRAWRGSVRVPSYTAEDDAMDDAAFDALLSRHSAPDGSDDAAWVVVDPTDPVPGPAPLDRKAGAPDAAVPSYGAVA